MNGWANYQLQDFIPFTADIYFRLFERMGETFWPLHLLTLTLGVTALVLALTQRSRLACLLPAPLLVFVGITFFIQRYSELNWAGGYVGYAFITQAVLLVLIVLSGFGVDKSPRHTSPPVVIGVAITLFGLIVMPLIAPLAGGSWYQAEMVGIHPDPTAMTTLGLALILLRGVTLWVVAVIPVLWIVISALTLQVLDASSAVASGAALFTVLPIVLTGLVWKSLESRSAKTK